MPFAGKQLPALARYYEGITGPIGGCMSQQIELTHAKISAPGLPALTGIRFFAALAVLLSHFAERSLVLIPKQVVDFLDGGRTAVSLFFVLSGFILAYNYYGRLDTKTRRRKYFVNRFARIYPVVLLALAISALGVAYALTHPQEGWMLDWYALDSHVPLFIGASFIAQLTMLTGWLPAASLNQPWNGPAWSISCEVFFYLLFPWLLAVMTKLRPLRLALVLVGAYAFQLLFIMAARQFAPAGQRGFLVSQFPVTHLFEFLIGIAAALWFARTGRDWLAVPGRRVGVLTGCLVAIVLISWLRPIDPRYFLLSPLFAVLVACLAALPNDRPGWLGWRPVVRLGEASFSLYMIHIPLVNLFTVLNTPPIIGWCLMAGTIALSILVFLKFEMPARLWLQRRYGMPKVPSNFAAVR